jgi:hypothetical protein
MRLAAASPWHNQSGSDARAFFRRLLRGRQIALPQMIVGDRLRQNIGHMRPIADFAGHAQTVLRGLPGFVKACQVDQGVRQVSQPESHQLFDLQLATGFH